MTNNDILWRIRVALDLSDADVAAAFAHVKQTVTTTDVAAWQKREDDPNYVACTNLQLGQFLDGLIIARRGEREGGPPPISDKPIDYNTVLRKLRIALDLQSAQMLGILASVDVEISKHELSALFRKPGHKHFRECLEPFMHLFLQGLQLRYTPMDDADDEQELDSTG